MFVRVKKVEGIQGFFKGLSMSKLFLVPVEYLT